jgi:hypothetical protein
MAIPKTKDDGKKAVATIKRATIDTANKKITTGPARPMKMTSISATEFKKNSSSSKPASKPSASKPAKPAKVSPAKAKAQKAAKDLQVKALQAKAKAAKSKAVSSRLRDENTPMPLAKGEYSSRGLRTALKAVGESGKGIMAIEREQNRQVKDWNDAWKPRTKQDTAAYGNRHPFEADTIKYREVRKSKMRGRK